MQKNVLKMFVLKTNELKIIVLKMQKKCVKNNHVKKMQKNVLKMFGLKNKLTPKKANFDKKENRNSKKK